MAEREEVMLALAARLGVPERAEEMERDGLFLMTLERVNGAAFMPFRFASTPMGFMVWQWQELEVA